MSTLERNISFWLTLLPGFATLAIESESLTIKRKALMAYKTFKRSCRNWREFAQGRKITEETGLTYQQAKQRCEEFNKNRTPAQIRKGTMLEFTEQ